MMTDKRYVMNPNTVEAIGQELGNDTSGIVSCRFS
jgi:hypothetical protein